MHGSDDRAADALQVAAAAAPRAGAAVRCCTVPPSRHATPQVAALFTDPVLYGKAIGCFYLVFVELEAALRKAMAADKREWERLDVDIRSSFLGRRSSARTCKPTRVRN